jgi:hypothetical protein
LKRDEENGIRGLLIELASILLKRSIHVTRQEIFLHCPIIHGNINFGRRHSENNISWKVMPHFCRKTGRIEFALIARKRLSKTKRDKIQMPPVGKIDLFPLANR